jgi:hypothetical protein
MTMRFQPFRDVTDPDEKRKQILWIAISFIIILAAWLGVVLLFGYQPLIFGMTYDEAVMLIGLAVLIFCSVLYLSGREREQRLLNRRLFRELKDTVALLDARVSELNGLCSTSAELSGSLDLDRIAASAIDALTGSMGADTASLVLFDEETGRPVYARNSRHDSAASSTYPQEISELWPEPLTGELDLALGLEAQTRAWNESGSLACAPLRLKNGLAGVLAARREGGFQPGDRDAMITLANMTAKALESAQHHAELRESYLATVRSLIYSLDARDNYTASHGHRVASLATRLAEQLGVSEGELRDLETFGPLHDVGKIGIRDAILMKPGSLTDEERAACQEHCVIGERIIRPLKPSANALALVRNHHESWDGRGYPDGLAGERIPRLARIVQVADCYDAMISDRPYRPTVSDEEVRAHFTMESSRRYDPAVVEALLAVLDEDRRASWTAQATSLIH